MNIHRPETFDEVIGHQDTIRFIRARIKEGNFPQFSLLYGEEGIGKTTIAKLIAKGLVCNSEEAPCEECESCKDVTERVIRQNLNTNNIITYKMSVEGGVPAVKDVLANLNTKFMNNKSKVIILEECHRMSNAAQDALLSDAEYLQKGVYIIACTTDISQLQKTFLSRAVPFNLNRLATKDILRLLNEEAKRRNLVIQGGDATLEIIATWAENKPRMALKALEAMGTNRQVTMSDITEFVSYLDLDLFVPLVSSLANSPLIGVNTIDKLELNVNTQNYLLDMLQETFKISMHQKSRKLSPEASKVIRAAVADIDSNVIARFLYEVASINQLTKQKLLAAYLRVHPALDRVTTHDSNLLDVELQTKAMNNNDDIDEAPKKRMSMSDLIRQGTLLED